VKCFDAAELVVLPRLLHHSVVCASTTQLGYSYTVLVFAEHMGCLFAPIFNCSYDYDKVVSVRVIKIKKYCNSIPSTHNDGNNTDYRTLLTNSFVSLDNETTRTHVDKHNESNNLSAKPDRRTICQGFLLENDDRDDVIALLETTKPSLVHTQL
jgi:hypothetical protein